MVMDYLKKVEMMKALGFEFPIPDDADLPKYEEAEAYIEDVSEVYEKISKLCNSFNQNDLAKIMFLNVLFDHRTLQSNFFRMIFKVIEDYSKIEDRYVDARNETTRKACKMIVENSNLYVPFI